MHWTGFKITFYVSVFASAVLMSALNCDAQSLMQKKPVIQKAEAVSDSAPSTTLIPLNDEIIVEEKQKKKRKKILRDRSATLEMAERYFTQRKYKKAIKYYDIILDHNMKDAYANYRKGLAVYQLQSYAEARPFFERALLTDPNIYRAYSTLGASYILEGDIDSAQNVLARLQDWVKECGLMCFGDQAAFTAEEDLKGMLKWAELKKMGPKSPASDRF